MIRIPIALAVLVSIASFWLASRAASDLPLRVETGEHQVRLRVEGHGSPAVVFEIGLGGALEEWTSVAPRVAEFSRVVSYDRIGGLADTQLLTGTQVAQDLHTALKKAGIVPPYVLVGQSFGGVYVRIFASLYPNEVAGLVLLDPSQEDFIRWMEIHHPTKTISKRNVIGWPEGMGIWKTLDELKSVGPLPDVPVTVVTAARQTDDPLRMETLPVWAKSHEDWVRTLPHGRHVIAPESGHGVQVEAADLVVKLIRETVAQARVGASVQFPTMTRPIALEVNRHR